MDDQKYLERLGVIESFIEFHPRIYARLSEADRAILRMYFLDATETAAWRLHKAEIEQSRPGILGQVETALKHLSEIGQFKNPL